MPVRLESRLGVAAAVAAALPATVLVTTQVPALMPLMTSTFVPSAVPTVTVWSCGAVAELIVRVIERDDPEPKELPVYWRVVELKPAVEEAKPAVDEAKERPAVAAGRYWLTADWSNVWT